MTLPCKGVGHGSGSFFLRKDGNRGHAPSFRGIRPACRKGRSRRGAGFFAASLGRGPGSRTIGFPVRVRWGAGSRRVMQAGREVGGRPLSGAPRPAPGRNAASAWRAGRAVAAVALPGARGELKAGKLRVRTAAGGGAWADAQGRAFHDVHARRGADVSCCRKAAFRAQGPRMGCLLLTCGHKRIS